MDILLKYKSSKQAERARLGLYKDELAKSLNVSMRTYYNWVNEETDVPGSALLKMAHMFNTSIDYLLKGCEDFERCKTVRNERLIISTILGMPVPVHKL